VRTLEHQMGQVAKGSEIGVKIALGTDSGSIGVDHGRAPFPMRSGFFWRRDSLLRR